MNLGILMRVYCIYVELPLKSIQERLGHASITTTGNIYVHLDLKQEKRVLRTLNFLRLF